jgi:hypothetical protein
VGVVGGYILCGNIGGCGWSEVLVGVVGIGLVRGFRLMGNVLRFCRYGVRHEMLTQRNPFCHHVNT